MAKDVTSALVDGASWSGVKGYVEGKLKYVRGEWKDNPGIVIRVMAKTAREIMESMMSEKRAEEAQDQA